MNVHDTWDCTDAANSRALDTSSFFKFLDQSIATGQRDRWMDKWIIESLIRRNYNDFSIDG